MKLFQHSTSPNTFLWIADLLLLVTKKYSPKEILQDKNISTGIHGLIKNTLQTLCDLATGKTVYVYDPKSLQAKVLNQELFKVYHPFQVIVPYSPQVYNLYHEEQRRKKEPITDETCRIRNLFSHVGPMDDEYLATFYRLVTFKSLKNMMVELLRNSYSPEKVDKVCYKTKEFLEPFFTIVLDKSKNNREFVEYASELLKTVIDSSR